MSTRFMASATVTAHPESQQVKVAVDNCIFTVWEVQLHLLLIQMTKSPCTGLWALAYDHDEVVAYARQRLEWKLAYTNVVWSLLPRRFALTELQKAYEAVLGRQLDKRNFRKKILSLGLVEPVGETAMRGAHRPAMLYRFTSREPKLVEML